MTDRQFQKLLRRLDLLESREGLLAATFKDTATGVGDTLRVVIPDYDDGEHLHGDPDGVVWMPRVDDAGDPVYPVVDDPAYVQEASDGTWVVVAWTPA